MIRTRYPGRCIRCQREILVGAQAEYDRHTKTLVCEACVMGQQDPREAEAAEAAPESALVVPVDPGQGGVSARREYVRRHDRREQKVRVLHPHVGSLLLTL